MKLKNNEFNLTAIYFIHGIYGDVEFSKSFTVENLSEIEKYELDHSHTEINNLKCQVINFDVIVYNNSDNDKVVAESNGSCGLPVGISVEDYYRMALLKSLGSINTISNINTLANVILHN